MRKHAIELGMPPDDVVRDFAGYRTLDSVYRARDIWGVTSMVIVTHRFHLPRSLFIADSLGVDAVGLEADKQIYTPRARFAAEWRDALARTAAWLDMRVLGTRPKYLGRPESLSGLEQERERGEKPQRPAGQPAANPAGNP